MAQPIAARPAADGQTSPSRDTPPPPLELPTGLALTLSAWARAGYPHERCGLLVGTSSGRAIRVERLTRAANLETQRAAHRFVLDPVDFVRADEAARRDGLDIVGIWHTHPDHPALPSPTDREWAWEGYSYVIVSVSRHGVGAIRSFRLDGAAFVEQPIEEARP